MTRILVTGLGVVSPYGRGRRAFWGGLAAGRCAIAPIGLFETDGFRARIGAEVPAGTSLPGVSSRRTRADRFALVAADEAVRDAGLSRAELAPAAVVVGGIGGGMLEVEAWYWRRETDGVDDPRLRAALPAVLPYAHADVVARRLRGDRAQGDRRPGLQLGRRGARAGRRPGRRRAARRWRSRAASTP